ncbi:hypothetical protein ACOGYQ_000165 [Edwardsiella piscicida]|uniref:hypothetical protein n=1 Tax=Edwardsiella TaxID=635 RepID=UPI0002C068FB|nr:MULTISPECIES: hypothetical protein [Edwardsiella]AGH74029.1 hypothetical protein ETAC_09540 [Edwardsiella piscicida C07-087]EKS7783447.1 hypothetical protein [Edwardsiella piscicida]UCQ23066.1 hypothetical protein DCE91_09695 [Edwardsiella piscicida]UCQ33273.1 hypothetical protein DCF34_09690 [Edwardsiella piscicida]WHQ15470.1 hypothetical protein MQ083_06805 [Edwardsiella anguillarum]
MKTIYIPKTNPDGYIDFPVPLDLDNYYVINVADDFELRNKVFDAVRMEFIEQQAPNLTSSAELNDEEA